MNAENEMVDPNRPYTVGCRLAHLVPDRTHAAAIEDAVTRVHRATFLATELANLHLRRCLEDHTAVEELFSANWLTNIYNEVTVGQGNPRVIAALRQTKAQHMPTFVPPSRTGLSQCIMYECRNLAAVAANNVWMHFSKRVRTHVRHCLALDETAYAALTKEQKTARRLLLLQLVRDILRNPTEAHAAPTVHHPWITTERATLGIDTAVGQWDDKPILYHLKAHPHRFVAAMAHMSTVREQGGGRAFALFPLRRTYTPRHVRFDQHALRELLKLGGSEHRKKKQRKAKTCSETSDPRPDEFDLPPLQCAHHTAPMQSNPAQDEGDPWDLPPLQCSHQSEHILADLAADEPELPPLQGSQQDLIQASLLCASSPETPAAVMPPLRAKRTRRSRTELVGEKAELFHRVLDLRAANVHRRHHFEFAFTTDGVCARLAMKAATKAHVTPLAAMPKRGMWSIDELKRVSRLEQLHVVGVDPGKRELVVGVDMDDPNACTPVRYTQRQRQFETCSKQYAHEGKRDKPLVVCQAEEELCNYRSRSADLATFEAYCAKRREGFERALCFYGDLGHRRRRWKTVIKAQQSEARLYRRFEALRKPDRPLVLAYGAWGLVAGRADMACNKGNAPCIGVGLMRKLARRFVVAPTPEAYTSKTCCKCLGECGPWAAMEEQRGKRIRGLRLCQTENCRLRINRDRNGATNIGTNFKRLFEGQGTIRALSEDELQLHRLQSVFDVS